MLKLSLNNLQILEHSNTHPYVNSLTSINRSYLDALKERYPNNSVYSQSRKAWIYSSIYVFDDEVTRIVVWGKATYYIINDGTVQILNCVAGDKITIPVFTPHWFSVEGEVTVLRFFAKMDGHLIHTNNITEEMTEAHRRLKEKLDITL